jgi:hypothetical protein
MQIGTTWDVLALTPAERLLGGMVEMAVLAAAPGGADRLGAPPVRKAARKLAPEGQEELVGAFVESLRAGTRKDDRWRQDLVAGMEAVAESRLRTILADLCVESGLVRDIRSATGPVVRRLDAICDLAHVPFAVADVRAAYGALAADLAGASGAAGADTAFAAGEAAFPAHADGPFGRTGPSPAPAQPYGADVHAVARLLNAVLAAVGCELPGRCDVVAVRSELHVVSTAVGEQRRALLAWALGFVTGRLTRGPGHRVPVRSWCPGGRPAGRRRSRRRRCCGRLPGTGPPPARPALRSSGHAPRAARAGSSWSSPRGPPSRPR